jgi:hypothetical protein
MAAIYRYQVPVDGQVYRIELTGEIVHVGTRVINEVEIWAIHDADGPKRERCFVVVGTGHPLPDAFLQVVGTAIVPPSGRLVWHLVEVTP